MRVHVISFQSRNGPELYYLWSRRLRLQVSLALYRVSFPNVERAARAAARRLGYRRVNLVTCIATWSILLHVHTRGARVEEENGGVCHAPPGETAKELGF